MEKPAIEEINIANDFSLTPIGRLKSQSDSSGEAFRLDILEPKLKRAIDSGKKLRVNMNGTIGYPTPFLHEAFGKLKLKFDLKVIKEHLIITHDNNEYVMKVWDYIENAGEIL
ncbi:MAG: STAS-like domain-containing protein [Bacteroidetes bacterium]|nr:STAS-like domain-containing protein [Bacteroidota bacterium]